MPVSGLLMGGVVVILILTTFYFMVRRHVPLATAMPLLACALLALQGSRASELLGVAFEHFATIAVLFTAIAIPAHMVERSNAYTWLAAGFGGRLGVQYLRRPWFADPLLVALVLAVTFVTASLLHNVTAMLIMTPITIRLCMRYGLPSRWLLSGALVASNLGGFSTAWGDTPNIIEAKAFGLTHGDFFREILPANLAVLTLLTVVVIALMPRSLRCPQNHLELAGIVADFTAEQREIWVDRRLLVVGLTTLVCTITLQVVFPDIAIAIGAVAILLAVLLERREERTVALKSLSFDTYIVFGSIFVIAGCVEHSVIGSLLQAFIHTTGAATWAITLSAYAGTTFTEAASWAAAATTLIVPVDDSNTAAWALGAGICAGSSACLTSASAGIVMAEESHRIPSPEHHMTFRNYLVFGLPFSLVMLAFYTLLFTLTR